MLGHVHGAHSIHPAQLARSADAGVADYQLADGATGIDAIASIRATLGTSGPALLVSGTTSPDVLGLARASGLPMLRKPITPAKLRAALTQLVRRDKTNGN